LSGCRGCSWLRPAGGADDGIQLAKMSKQKWHSVRSPIIEYSNGKIWAKEKIEGPIHITKISNQPSKTIFFFAILKVFLLKQRAKAYRCNQSFYQ
jgi:hypothetical protein